MICEQELCLAPLLAVLQRRLARLLAEEADEERGSGETQRLGHLGNGHLRVVQQHLGFAHQGAVDPLQHRQALIAPAAGMGQIIY